jgi:hypothetical protein
MPAEERERAGSTAFPMGCARPLVSARGITGLKHAINQCAGNLEPLDNRRCAQALRLQLAPYKVRSWAASLVDASQLRFGDAFHLPFAPQFGFELGEQPSMSRKHLPAAVPVSSAAVAPHASHPVP